MPANGHHETPRSTVELKFEIEDIEYHGIFIVLEKVPRPIIGMMFLQRNHTALDMRQGTSTIPIFPCNSTQRITNFQTSWKPY